MRIAVLSRSIDIPGFGNPAVATVASAAIATATILTLLLSDITASLWELSARSISHREAFARLMPTVDYAYKLMFILCLRPNTRIPFLPV
jgi:hypothetical protein